MKLLAYQRATRSDRVAIVIGLLVLILSAAWAFMPIDQHPIPTFEPGRALADLRSDAVPPLDVAAFDAELWHVPPKPIVTVETPKLSVEAPPQLKFELVGVLTRQDSDGITVHTAAIYDPTADRLHLVTVGDAVGHMRVVSVSRDRIELSDTSGVRSLELDRGPPAGATLADLLRREE